MGFTGMGMGGMGWMGTEGLSPFTASAVGLAAEEGHGSGSLGENSGGGRNGVDGSEEGVAKNHELDFFSF